MNEQQRQPAGSSPRSWEITSAGSILAILALMNFLNYVDRQVIAPLIPLLQAKPSEGGMGLSSSQIGLLSGAFMFVHSIASVPLGILADRFARRKIIAIGVGVWSVATAAAGFAQNFVQLIVSRSAVGIGEATYAPAASAIISERFSPAARARAMGVFQLGLFLGGAVGAVVGGLVGHAWGWRAAFFVVGVPGLILTALVLFIHEPPRGLRGARESSTSGSIAIDIRAPGSMVAIVWINVAGVFITFFMGAAIIWMTTFIVRYHYGGDERAVGRVAVPFGLILVTAGAAGTMAASFMADRLERGKQGAGRLLAIAIGCFAAVPFTLLGLYAPSLTMFYIALWCGVFFCVWYLGPILATLHDVTPPHRRATATGAYLLLVHLLGDALSPWVVGFIDDHGGSLRQAMLVPVVALAAGGVAALAAIAPSRKVAKLKRRSPPG